MFCGLKFGGVGGKEDQPDSLGNRQVAFAMPTSVVEHEDNDPLATGPGFLSESRQQGFEERLRDAVGNVPETFAGRRRDEGCDVEPFEAMMTVGDRAHADRPPDGAHDWLQAEPVFVRREGFDGNAGVGLRLFGDDIGEFFLKASCCASVAAFGLRGRGFWIDQPIAFKASQPRCGASFSSPNSSAIQRATFPLVQRPPSGGGWSKRAPSRSSNSGFRTVGLPPLPRRRSPRATGPTAL